MEAATSASWREILYVSLLQEATVSSPISYHPNGLFKLDMITKDLKLVRNIRVFYRHRIRKRVKSSLGPPFEAST